ASLPEVKAVFHSPAETCVVEWTRAYLDKLEWWKVAGTCVNYEGQVYNNAKLAHPKDVVLPLPAREILPDKNLYFSTLSELRPFTAGMSVFGCPYGCDYCSNRLTPVHPRSAEDIVNELEVCERELGYREIDYFDANFLLPPERVFEIADLYAKRNLSIRWSCRVRVDKVEREQLKAMARSNCSWIGYGIESGDEDVLRGVNKYQGGIDHIRDVLKATHEEGIGITGFFILGLPGEDEDSLKNTLEFIGSAPFDFVQISPYWPVPGTPVYNRLVQEAGMDPWKTVIESDSLDHDMHLPGTKFSLREMHEHTSRFYREFYFRPSQFLKILKKTSNIAQFKKYSTAGMDLMKSWLP
ncbi:radical SAM protein, partial [bacterium]|nr:radical SAM protein [bacterium]